MKLTNNNTMTNLPAPHNEVGFCSSFRIGDNTPQDLAVFLCLPFLDAPNFWAIKSIMTVLFEQPLRLVVPIHDTANSLNTVTKCFAALRDGLTTQRIGITA